MVVAGDEGGDKSLSNSSAKGIDGKARSTIVPPSSAPSNGAGSMRQRPKAKRRKAASAAKKHVKSANAVLAVQGMGGGTNKGARNTSSTVKAKVLKGKPRPRPKGRSKAVASAASTSSGKNKQKTMKPITKQTTKQQTKKR